MTHLHLPWLWLGVAIPLAGSGWAAMASKPEDARRRSLLASGVSLACVLGAWIDFVAMGARVAGDRWGFRPGMEPLVIDALNAPLLPLGALLCFLTNLATLRTKLREFSFSRSLLSQSILLATFGCRHPWLLVGLLAIGTVPPYLELRASRRPTRVYVLHMGLFVALLVAGQGLRAAGVPAGWMSTAAVLSLTAAVLLRSGVVPVHCWMTDLFEHATFGTALLFVTPMVGAYAVLRLVLPIAPAGVLHAITLVSLFTAVYSAGMALVQRDARRFFCYLFLSHSSLVLVGLETATPIGLTGALSLWISVSLSLTGFGLTLRCVESRTGRVSIADYHGLFEHVPMLAVLFLITGLASIGFPGTIGFVALELLVEGAVQALPLVGSVVVMVAALNGLAVTHAYFRIFTGRPHVASVDLRVRPAERVSVLLLILIIVGGGLFPRPGVLSRYRAAIELAGQRPGGPADEAPHGPVD